MAPHKKQFLVVIKWEDFHRLIVSEGKTDYYGPFSQSEAEVKLWIARFSTVNQGRFKSIEYKVLIKP